MKLTQSEVKKAYKISKVIQKYLDLTGDTNIRSTDVFPYLVRSGLFEEDKNNGLFFRKFLKKVANSGELRTLIPQCSMVKPIEDEIFSEWYFHSAKNEMPKPKNSSSLEIETNNINIESLKMTSSVKAIEFTKEKEDTISFDESVQIISKLISGVNPITNQYLEITDVCRNTKVNAALKTIINPESYRSEIDKIKKEENPRTETSGRDEWFRKAQITVKSWRIKRDESKLKLYELSIRGKFPRAFEYWTENEIKLAAEGWKLYRNVNRLTILLERTPQSIMKKLESLNIIEKKTTNNY